MASKISVRWFYASDVPKRDERPFSVKSGLIGKTPSVWTSFSDTESVMLESEYNLFMKREGKGKVAVLEDHLFEVDIEKRELYSIYWPGLVYEVRRGTWFALEGTKYIPCNENLAIQVEDGYLKFRPWTYVSPSMSFGPKLPSSPEKSEDSKAISDSKPELRWELFGPFINQYVLYINQTTAILLNDMITTKLARAILGAFTNDENMVGVKLVRGWSEVEKLQIKSPKSQSSAVSPSPVDMNKSPGGYDMNSSVTSPESAVVHSPDSKTSNPIRYSHKDMQSSTKSAKDHSPHDERSPSAKSPSVCSDELPPASDEYQGKRTIKHLVLAIHGIGQKLGEKTESVNFVHDCNVLRKLFKQQASEIYESIKSDNKFDVPEGGGIQVLPIHWRHHLAFNKLTDMKTSERDPFVNEGSETTEETSDENQMERDPILEDITLEGIPGIRSLVSDVVLDVLLYLTPKYRQQMINNVTKELNRIYHEFKSRNPDFDGQVHLYGHSLGSLLSFDILCHQRDVVDDKSHTPSITPIPVSASTEIDLSELFQNITGTRKKSSLGVHGSIEKTELTYPRLEFPIENLFMVGSPVGLFTLLQGYKIQAYENSLLDDLVKEPTAMCVSPKVTGLYNIFHPHDPVAYRIEPLVHKKYSRLKPVPIPYTKGGLTGTLVGIQDLSNDIEDKVRSMFESVRVGFLSTTTGVVTSATKMVERIRTKSTSMNSFETLSTQNKDLSSIPNMTSPTTSYSKTGTFHSSPSDDQQQQEQLQSKKFRKNDMELLNPRKRIDYTIQEGVLENPYLSALGVHMNYWSEPDAAMFIVKEVYKFPVPRDFLKATSAIVDPPSAHTLPSSTHHTTTTTIHTVSSMTCTTSPTHKTSNHFSFPT